MLFFRNKPVMIMPYSPETIARAIGATFLQGPLECRPIETLLVDSRQLYFPEVGIFFAIRGGHYDGHDFLAAVYEDGVRNLVVSRPIDAKSFPGANIFQVEDTLRALQQLAAYHRSQFDVQVLGITGSNGKTIVKEWLFQLLQGDYQVARSPRSFNSQVGVPLSVWQLQPRHEIALFEAGISRMGEMQWLAGVIRPTVGLFTNLGEAHNEGFPDMAAKLREKLVLFRNVETVVYCRDDEMVDREIRAMGRPCFTWSRQYPADLQVVDIRQAGRFTLIEGIFQGLACSVRIPFSDTASIENALHCWAFLLYMGISQEHIARRMEELEPVAMRLELKEGLNECVIINDAYNFDFTSLNQALYFLERQAQGLRRTVIISDMLQGGEPPETMYRRIARMLTEKNVERVIGVGAQARRLIEWLPFSVRQQYFSNTASLLAVLSELDFHREAILIKGARLFGLELVAEQLARQAHQTRLEIHLDALAHNLRVYQRMLGPGVRTMAMVKAAAYGSGSREVARLLEFCRADYLCVAYGDEGADLRRAGIQLPILVLNPEPGGIEQLLRYRLEPKIFSVGQLKAMLGYLRRHNGALPLHISIDSGMHRLGFDSHELPGLLELLEANPGLEVRSVFSHLAASEDPRHDAFTHEQYRRFEKAYEEIARVLGYRPLRHLLNSSGIHRFPQYQMDMVRLGIGLYGIDASKDIQEKLRVVLFLKATISQIKTLGPGESIGYGRLARVEEEMRIATISIGYADGLPRSAGNGRFAVVIRGKAALILGAICMDMCMVDVTHIPDASPGDIVSIFGEAPPAVALAQVAQTIPYEIFTGISSRVKRVYVQE
jgi:alanine racemase